MILIYFIGYETFEIISRVIINVLAVLCVTLIIVIIYCHFDKQLQAFIQEWKEDIKK